MTDFRVIAAVFFGLCAIGIDFTSMMMSVISDLLCVTAMFAVLWPKLKK